MTPKYRAPALVSVSLDDVTFTSPTGSSVGRWHATTAHNRGATNEDTIVVYSDVGPPKRTPIGDHEDYGASFTDTQPLLETDPPTNILEITIGETHKDLIASSSFPTTASQTFTVIPSNIRH